MLFSSSLAFASIASAQAYNLVSHLKGQKLVDAFSFQEQNGGDNGGVANYLNRDAAYSAGLVNIMHHGAVRLSVNTQGNDATRGSVKLTSNAQYNSGLFIFDIAHIPDVCGSWPALWMLGGGTWPEQGEVSLSSICCRDM